MKKTLAILLSLMLAAGVVTSCGQKKKNEDSEKPSSTVTDTNKDENKKEDETLGTAEGIDTSAFTVQGIIDSIYAQKAPQFMYGSIPVDMQDKDSYMTYLGIEDISKIKEAAVSESMIGAQAYSLVVARVADGEDAAKIAEEMKNGINNSKWVCVTADDVKVTTYGDLICFCMIDTEYKDAFTAQDAMDAFNNVVTGKADYIDLSEDTDVSEDAIPDADVTDGVIDDETNTEEGTPDLSGDAENAVNKEEAKEPEAKPEAPSSNTGKYTLQGIIDSIYAQKAPLFMFGSIPVDMTDEFSYNTYLGIKDPAKISEAVVSESMIGAQAYSLVVARVAKGYNAADVAKEMKAGIDNSKWVCVTADDVKVTTYGDLICFCMIDTEYKDALTAQDVIDAFTAIMKGKAKYEEGATPNIPGYEEPEFEEDFTDVDMEEVVVGANVLESIINDMYAIKAPQFMLGSIPVDMTDEFSYNTYLGTNDPSKFVEAVASEAMIGAQAYSLVVARVAPGVDANEVAKEMKAGINPRKWICVEADDIKTAVVGDLVCFCMIDTEYAADYTAQDAIDAFISVTAA
ncbi:MAG: hypothetical protein IKI97_06550 [Clostridia bacterium]|nr:hypothetical protein [Clostridia bacterium]